MGNFYIAEGAAQSSKKQDWETPLDFFNALDLEFNFELDVCASAENALCADYFTEQDDCLVQDWGARFCFMNPPYGRDLKNFIAKAYEESAKGATVVCLIPARTDTSYWHDYIFKYAADIRFIRGRLKFGNCKTAAPFPSAVVIFGDVYKDVN